MKSVQYRVPVLLWVALVALAAGCGDPQVGDRQRNGEGKIAVEELTQTTPLAERLSRIETLRHLSGYWRVTRSIYTPEDGQPEIRTFGDDGVASDPRNAPEDQVPGILKITRTGSVFALDHDLMTFYKVGRVRTSGQAIKVKIQNNDLPRYVNVEALFELIASSRLRVSFEASIGRTSKDVDPKEVEEIRTRLRRSLVEYYRKISPDEFRTLVKPFRAARGVSDSVKSHVLKKIEGDWELVAVQRDLKYSNGEKTSTSTSARQIPAQESLSESNGSEVTFLQNPKRIKISSDGKVEINSGAYVGELILDSAAGRQGVVVTIPVGGSGDNRYEETLGVPTLQKNGSLTFSSSYKSDEVEGDSNGTEPLIVEEEVIWIFRPAISP